MKMILCRVIAVLSFFTRLPFWRLADVPKECYERVVPLWPLVGYLTALSSALVFSISSAFLPLSVAVVLAFLSRVLLTGAIHEDGLADFCDGFGGGTNRERILSIMKDSHIGTFGVLGLILYFLLQYNLVLSVAEQFDSQTEVVFLFFSADVFCKWTASTIIYFLPYARKESEAKNGLLYALVPRREKIISFMVAVLSIVVAVSLSEEFLVPLLVATLMAMLSAGALFFYMHKKIQSYTGDCCGATFLICELAFWLGASGAIMG